jgi:hypothetical protein
MTDSSTGGILTNLTPALNDDALDKALMALFSSLTGLAPQYVRQRWSPEPQTPPDFNATWCAVGVTSISDDDYPAQVFDDGTGLKILRHEMLDVQATFYGAKAQQAMRAASDGVLILQNNEGIMADYGLIFHHYDQPIKVPQLIQNRWSNRIDRTFYFRRQIISTYDVLNVQSVEGEITNGTLSFPINIDT